MCDDERGKLDAPPAAKIQNAVLSTFRQAQEESEFLAEGRCRGESQEDKGHSYGRKTIDHLQSRSVKKRKGEPAVQITCASSS